MYCILVGSEQPIIYVLLEHQAVPGRKLPQMFFHDFYEGYLLHCAMIILNSHSKCFRMSAVRAHTAYK
jgi:hypothetical protein